MRHVKLLLFIATSLPFILAAQLPKITSFAPNSGAQGTKIKIEGTNLNAPTNVTVGGVKASIVNKDSIGGKFIEIIINEGPSGHVAVYNASGSDSLSGFTYVGPRIFSFTPQSGKVGDTIKISGTNFTGATSVSFAGIAAKNFTVNSDVLITAVLSVTTTGSISVQTSKGTGTSKTSLSYSGLRIYSFSPKIGSKGTKVNILGFNLSTVNAVKFGNVSPQSFTFANNTITATLDSGSTGLVKVFSSIDSASLDSFTFVKNPVPKINSFTPKSAGVSETVRIDGENLFDISNIYFGGVSAFIETRDTVSGKFVIARLNEGASGYIKINTLFGTDSLSGFIYHSPVITSFSPISGISRSSVMIKGKNFTDATEVTFGGINAESYTVVSDSVLNVVIGGGTTGKIVVRSQKGYGRSQTDFQFSGPVISSFSPTSASSGSVIKIIGSRFEGVKSVKFGGVNAVKHTLDSTNIINATVGSGASGAISVETNDGTTYKTGFTYLTAAPYIMTNHDTILCPGSKAILTSSLSTGNQWFKNGIKMTGDTARSIIVSTPGNYTVAQMNNDSIVAISRSQSIQILEGKAAFSINDSTQCEKGNRFIFINTTKYNFQYQRSKSYWTIVDTGNSQISSTRDTLSYSFSKPGTYSITLISKAENYGCADTITKKVTVLVSPVMARPQINGYLSDTTFCFTDTLKLSAKEKYSKFYWSTGDTSESINIVQSGQYYLRVGERGGICYSDPSVKITVIKNTNPLPAIVRVGDDLISSNANYYRWYQNNIRQVHDTSNTFRIRTRGIYQVATSRDKQCWSLSKEYLVQFDPITQGQNEIQLSAFPNPSNGLFFTQIKLKKNYSGFINMIISDLSASQTWTIKRYMFNDTQIRIPINMNLKKGSYTLSVNVNGYRQKSIQFVVL